MKNFLWSLLLIVPVTLPADAQVKAKPAKVAKKKALKQPKE
jgi:hypothetical protein